jgi:LysM repeat protein
MPRTYEIKSGDSRKKVADIFGVSVSDLLAYNESTLGDSWEAGAEVRDPLEIPKLIKKSFDLGATPEQVAKVLRIDVKTLKENYDVPESLSEVSVPKRKKAPTALLKAIAVEAKRVPTELLQEIIVDAKRVPEELLQDIVVPDRAKKILLENIEVPERERVPEELLQDIVVPERAKKILFENIEVPDREQKEVPAPYTDYTSTMDQRLTEVTTPERQQVPTELLQEVAVPDRELAEPLKSTGIVIPQSALDAINPPAKRRSPDDIVIPQSAIDIRQELANEDYRVCYY